MKSTIYTVLQCFSCIDGTRIQYVWFPSPVAHTVVESSSTPLYVSSPNVLACFVLENFIFVVPRIRWEFELKAAVFLGFSVFLASSIACSYSFVVNNNGCIFYLHNITEIPYWFEVKAQLREMYQSFLQRRGWMNQACSSEFYNISPCRGMECTAH